MRTKWLRISNLVLVGISTLFGLSACKKEPQIQPCYGVITTEMRCLPMAETNLADSPAFMDEEYLKKDENKIP